ncbi:RNA-directed DNA polymerase, eukaryota [Tanacetum coccineum]
MSSRVSNRTVNIAEPPRNQKTFLKSKDLACPTCKKCIYSSNHDECILKYLSKSSNVYLKTTPPRSGLTWKPTGRIFTQVGLKRIPIRKPVETRYNTNDSASSLGKETHNPKTVIICANYSSLSAVMNGNPSRVNIKQFCGSSRFGSKVLAVVGIIVRISVVVGASAVATDGGEEGGVYSCDRYRCNASFSCLDMIHALKAELHSLSLSTDRDTLRWGLTYDGSFTAGAKRKHIDDVILPNLLVETSWCNILPRKVNIIIWRMRLDRLPHRLNLSRRGQDIHSIDCPVCSNGGETNDHIFYSCDVASNI